MTSLVHVISSSSTDAKLGKDLEEAAAILSQLWSNLKVEKEKALVSNGTNWMKVYTMPGHITRCTPPPAFDTKVTKYIPT